MTTPDTGGKSDRGDNIQEERDDNGGDDPEEDEDDEEHDVGRVRCPVKTETGTLILLHNINSEEDTFEGGWCRYCNVSSWRTCRV